LLKYAQSVRDALLAHDQHAREIEAERERRLLNDAQQRERDLRRDMYDLARERAHAAALEAKLKCLKATSGPPAVAYEVVEVPVQADDIPSPAVDVNADTPVDTIVVQSLVADMTQSSTPIPIVYRPAIADALTVRPHATDTVYSSDSTSVLISVLVIVFVFLLVFSYRYHYRSRFRYRSHFSFSFRFSFSYRSRFRFCKTEMRMKTKTYTRTKTRTKTKTISF